MTKEELEKEADNYVCIHWTEDEEHDALVKKAYLAGAESREKRIAELEKELQNWKDEWQEQIQKADDEGYARTLLVIQLTKAKTALRNVIDYLGQFCSDYPDCVIEAKKILN